MNEATEQAANLITGESELDAEVRYHKVYVDIMREHGEQVMSESLKLNFARLAASLRAAWDRERTTQRIVEAAIRLRECAYVDWCKTGGPNECEHKVSELFSCRRCDEKTMDAAKQEKLLAAAAPRPAATTKQTESEAGREG